MNNGTLANSSIMFIIRTKIWKSTKISVKKSSAEKTVELEFIPKDINNDLFCKYESLL